MKVKFKSLSSGSCGNCYFLGLFDGDDKMQCGIVIDAGVSPRRARKELTKDNIPLEAVSSLLVTHDHLDHIRSLGSWCKHVGKPVFTTPVLHEALSYHTMTRDWIGAYKRIVSDKGWTDIGGDGAIKARYFIVPHDATQTVGYAIKLEKYLFVIMTDIGHMTEEALDWARQADTVVIESNYDLEMLRKGPYPIELQDRICLGGGHLSNSECAEAIKNFIHPELRNIFLCHLSEHNNTPKLALEASKPSLGGLNIRLCPLPRQTASPLFEI